ncbi:hypothetical protein K439DRAFT_1370150 [Ramaria rubella]|nr:hypothetical protein K439DRAFT_1370150 [Ramaria rubella]
MLTLQHFILRAEAINLYRSAVRASRSIPDATARRETIAWIRAEFERSRAFHDTELIKSRLSLIRRDLKEILPSIAISSGKV